ncbi:DNA polymerase III subunit delta [Nakamurella endophytica]|nr:DNA polymerase III subunit delta [Nakamurella endophytica]
MARAAADSSDTGTRRGADGAPGPLVLVLGDEELLVDRAVAATVAAARRARPDVERRDAAASELSTGLLADLVAPSLFAEPRVVVVRGAAEATKDVATALAGYAGDPVDGVTLVVAHAGGARNKAVVDAFRAAGAQLHTCERITRPGERLDFVRAEIKRCGGTSTPDGVAALVEAVGSDLRELASAAGQLVADTGGLIDESAVHRYHRGRAEVNGFAIADLAVAGDVPAALEALRWALAVGVPHVLIADALADGVRTIARVSGARGGNAYALASELGMPPWKVDRARGAARAWSEEGLARGMAVVAEVNGAVKGAAADPDYALEKAVIEVGRARRAR